MTLRRLVLGSMLMSLAGCATLIHGPYQKVRIESEPPGAIATISAVQCERGPQFIDAKKQTVTTPATVQLRRDNTYRVELAKPGYRLGTKRVVSSYDWLWAPAICGPCEAVGELPTYDMKGHALPVRFAEAAFYEYPKGFFRSWSYGLRLFSPEAWLGTSFKLKPGDGGPLSDWHAMGEPTITAHLEPAN